MPAVTDKLRLLGDVDNTGRAAGKMLQVDTDDLTHVYVDPPEGGGGGGGGAGTFCDVFGDGVETTIDVEHDLGTSCVQVGVVEVASGDALVHGTDYTWLILDDDTVRLVFSSAPDTDDARVVVLASGGNGGSGGALQASRAIKSTTTPVEPIAWTAVDYDDLGVFDLGTDATKATIQQDGRYLVVVGLATPTSDTLLQLRRNDVVSPRLATTRMSSSGTLKGQDAVWMGELAANDVLSVHCQVTLTTSSENFIAITRL